MSRRSLFRGALAGAAGVAAVGAGLGSAACAQAAPPKAVRPVPRGRTSIQLWTVRDALGWPTGNAGYDDTLRAIAEMGYPRVEQALGYFGRSAAELRAFYDSIGIWASSSHDGITSTDAALTQKLENAATLGQRFMVVPYLDSPDLAQWQAWADRMNEEATAAREYGIAYGYHNHAHEFTRNLGNGVTPWDVFTERLDPSVVHLEVDIYWAVTGGVNKGMNNAQAQAFALDVIKNAPQKVRQYHVKDRHLAGGDMADLGKGFIDFARFFAAHQVEEYIVENDSPDVTPLTTAQVGWDYLRQLRF